MSKKIIGVTVGTPTSTKKIEEELKPVLYTEQTLTNEQKAQARENIGVAAVCDSVETMKQNTALTAGNCVRTTGYYEPNDGGGGFYKIYDEKPSGWCEELANGKFAQLQTDGTINVKQAGAKQLGYISEILNRIISETDIAEIYIPAGRYGFNSTVVLSRNVHIRGAGISDLQYGTYINTDCNEAFTTNDIARTCILEKLRFQGSLPSAVDPTAPDFTILFSRCNFSASVIRDVKGVAYNIILNGSFYQCSLMDNCDFQQVKTAVFTTKLMPSGYEHFASATTGELGDAKITNTYFNGSRENKCYFAYDYKISTTTIDNCYIDFFYAVVANSQDAEGIARRKCSATFIGNTIEWFYRLFENQEIWGVKFIGNNIQNCSTKTTAAASQLQRFLTYLTEDEIESGAIVFNSELAGVSTISGNTFATLDTVYKFSTISKALVIMENAYDDYYGNLVDCTYSGYSALPNYPHTIDALDNQNVTELPNPRGRNTYCGHKLYYNNALVTNMNGVWRYTNGEEVTDEEVELFPTPTTDDNGKFLKVVNGQPVWSAIEILDLPTVIHGLVLGVNAPNFWDDFQENGNRTNYRMAFASELWTDEFFEPKYSMNCTNADGMFMNARITTIPEGKLDTTNATVLGSFAENAAFVTLPRIVIGANCTYTQRMFMQAKQLEEIETLAVYGVPTSYANMFFGCESLQRITIEGEICFDVNFMWSKKLTVASMQSIITHLKNYAGTANANTHTVTFATACLTALDAEGATAPGDVTWRSYVASLGWKLAAG